MRPVVDAHTHFLPAGAIKAETTGELWHGMYVERSAESASAAASRPPSGKSDKGRTFKRAQEYFQGPEERLTGMKAAGVDTQVVSVTPALYRYDVGLEEALPMVREVNDELSEWQTAYPSNYRGLATLPLQDLDASIVELDRAINDLGLIGVMVDTHVNGEEWDSADLFPLLRSAEELGALVFVHPGTHRSKGLLPRHQLRNYIGNPFETTVAVGSLIFGGVLDKLPDIRMLFAHAGGFACADAGRFDHGFNNRPAEIERLPSEYFKLLYFDSLTNSEIVLRMVIDVVGIEQVVLGTDFPGDMGPADPFNWIQSCSNLSQEEKDAILMENAEGLIA